MRQERAVNAQNTLKHFENVWCINVHVRQRSRHLKLHKRPGGSDAAVVGGSARGLVKKEIEDHKLSGGGGGFLHEDVMDVTPSSVSLVPPPVVIPCSEIPTKAPSRRCRQIILPD